MICARPAPFQRQCVQSSEQPRFVRVTQLSFASLLREHRLARGVSQESLAEAAGLSREAIGLLERGARRSPRRDTVAMLARTLELSERERARLMAAAVTPRAERLARNAHSAL